MITKIRDLMTFKRGLLLFILQFILTLVMTITREGLSYDKLLNAVLSSLIQLGCLLVAVRVAL